MTTWGARLVVCLLGLLIGNAAPASASPAVTTTNSAPGYVYDAPITARLQVQRIMAAEASSAQFIGVREIAASPTRSTRITSTTPARLFIATNTARAITRPAGIADDWVSEVAANGKGTVWRAPGTSGNAGTVRIMEPTAQYPNGYVRFYNQHGQPIGLNGNPGPNSVTHIPLNPDGTYVLPKGWGGAG